MNCRILLPGVAVFVLVSLAPAQIPDSDFSGLLETVLESIESEQGSDADFESWIRELEALRRDPLNLNSAGKEDFQKLPFLTDFQVSSLLTYRQLHGPFLSLNELNFVYGFTDQTIRLLLPFVSITKVEALPFSNSGLWKAAHHEMTLRTQHVFEKAAGYRELDPVTGKLRYPGNPWMYYARYAFESSRHIKAGITVEKDAGEELFRGNNPNGFDFHSAYVMLNETGPIKTIVAGDFRLQFGQGLTLWNGASPGKSSLVMNVVKRQDEVKAFTSSDENDSFRGMAASIRAGNFTATGYFSSRTLDANITDTLVSGTICFSSFQESGYHRTTAENKDENALREISSGGNILYRNNWLKAGTTLTYSRLDKTMEAGLKPEDAYKFRGNRICNWGIDYSMTFGKIQLFGETATGNNAWATLNGALIYAGKSASFSMVYRYYQPGYYGLHTAAFSEGSSNSNEEAFYLGSLIHPFRNWKISAYADIYRFPWLRYNVSAPSEGADYLVQVDFSPRKADFFARWHYERNARDADAVDLPLPVISHISRNGLRLHASLPVSRRIRLQNRIEAVWVDIPATGVDRGIMVYQDIEYRFTAVPLILNARLAWFKTDSYESRIYAYENDMTSGFSFSPLYLQGVRTYMMIRYNTDNLTFGIRFAQSNFSNRHTIGSGSDEIKGHTKSEIKLQILVRF
jgi:hypothetical protein